MKRNIMVLVLLLCCFVIMCTGCTDDTKVKKICVKCGRTATTTLCGPADIMQKNGISISDCRQITHNIYSASVCDSCVGPVAEIKPDAGFSGDTPFFKND